MGYPPRPQLTMDKVEEVDLFPEHEPISFNFLENETLWNLCFACNKLMNINALGLGTPPYVIKEMSANESEFFLDVYKGLANRGVFPKQWKKALLILLMKNDKLTAFRSLCLLDIEKKLFEHLILIRLKVDRTGGLAKIQFGIVEGRQTVDAILVVTRKARQASLITHILIEEYVQLFLYTWETLSSSGREASTQI